MKVFPENINPDLLTAFLHGETDAQETVLVREWIESSAENKAEFEGLKKIWDEAAEAFPGALDVDTESAWAKVSERISRAESGKRHHTLVHRPWAGYFRTGLKVAAVFIPLIVVTVIYLSRYNKTATLSLATVADTANVMLSDGSLVQMNKNTTLSYPDKFKGNTREVSMSGEAFFTITPNGVKPFFIHMDRLDLKVVGTSFFIRAVPGEAMVEVSVRSGKVMLYALSDAKEKTDSLMLTAGDKGVYRTGANTFGAVSSVDENTFFRISKTLVFQRMPLDSVILTLEKNYDIRIEKKNDSIGKLRLSARFEGTDIENIMEIIRESLGLRMMREDSLFVLDGPAGE
jgi:ferric-dicitrate binding protein FerR (iron transport regulator)